MPKSILIRITGYLLIMSASLSGCVPQNKTVLVGDGYLSIELPPHFIVEREADGTILAYAPRKDYANLRISYVGVFSEKKDFNQAGTLTVSKDAVEKGFASNTVGQKIYYEEVKSAIEDKTPLTIHRFFVGYENVVVIMSCTIVGGFEQDKMSLQLLELIPSVIQSIAKTKGTTQHSLQPTHNPRG
jgi:hypothetical protein